MMTGRFQHAERALATGLVSEVVDDDRLEAAGRAMVADLLSTSPIGLRKTKQTMVAAAAIEDLGAVIALEERTQMACFHSATFAQTSRTLGGRKTADDGTRI
jgi:enoyl-CoA hydratase/carnithine racemase